MLDRLAALLRDFETRLNRQPTFGWAVVTSVSPLQIRYDAQDEPIAGTPDTNVSGLSVGDRVWCQRIHRRNVILGRGGGSSNKVLWSGALFMQAGQVVTLSERVEDQQNGIALFWSGYTPGTLQNYGLQTTIVPKRLVEAAPGSGVECVLSRDSHIFKKYVYVNQTTVTGHAQNAGGSAPQNLAVLREVIGF